MECTREALDCLCAAFVWALILLAGAFLVPLVAIVAGEALSLMLPVGNSIRHMLQGSL